MPLPLIIWQLLFNSQKARSYVINVCYQCSTHLFWQDWQFWCFDGLLMLLTSLLMAPCSLKTVLQRLLLWYCLHLCYYYYWGSALGKPLGRNLVSECLVFQHRIILPKLSIWSHKVHFSHLLLNIYLNIEQIDLL